MRPSNRHNGEDLTSLIAKFTDKAAKTLQCGLEKFCERNTQMLYRLNESHKPVSSSAEKSFKRAERKVFGSRTRLVEAGCGGDGGHVGGKPSILRNMNTSNNTLVS